MKTIATAYVHFSLLLLFVSGLGFLTSCEKTNPENSTSRNRTSAIKIVFDREQYSKGLFEAYNDTAQIYWEPIWKKGYTKKNTKGDSYTFVPLTARLYANQKISLSKLTMKGVRRFILVKHATDSDCFYLATYIASSLQRSSAEIADKHFDFATFDGVLTLRGLSVSGNYLIVYKNGQRLVQSTAPNSDKGSVAVGNKTAEETCEDYYTCEWVHACAQWSTATRTFGLNGCEEPAMEACNNWGHSWSISGYSVMPHCRTVDDPPPPGDGSGDDDDDTPTDPNSPCDQMNTLGAKPGFQTAVTQLKQPGNLRGNHEVGYIYNGNGADYNDYRSMSGSNGQLPYNPPYPIDGNMHIHNLDANDINDKALPIPSPTDLIDIYTLWRNGYIINDGTFTSTVITAFGDMYAIKISNSADFQSFGAGFLMSSGYIDRVFFCPKCDYPLQSGTASMLGQSAFKVRNEVNMLKFLKDNHSGLELLKYDPASNTWFQRSLDINDNLLSDPCQ